MGLMNKDKENPLSNIIDMHLTSPIANQHSPLVLWISEIISSWNKGGLIHNVFLQMLEDAGLPAIHVPSLQAVNKSKV